VLLERFGGESIPAADLVGPDGFIRVGRKHCTIKQLLAERLIPPDVSSHFTTVTSVRNPFDSLVSLYVKKRETYHGERFLQDPTSWVHKVRGFVEDMEFCRTHSFDEWVMRRYSVSSLDKLLGRGRRSLYGRYTEGVENVMRFERLQQDFEAVMRRIGVEGDLTIPHFNATQQRRASYQSYYTPEARRTVEYVFKPDLDRYGYTFETVADREVKPAGVGS
jgi:hypothetical protein